MTDPAQRAESVKMEPSWVWDPNLSKLYWWWMLCQSPKEIMRHFNQLNEKLYIQSWTQWCGRLLIISLFISWLNHKFDFCLTKLYKITLSISKSIDSSLSDNIPQKCNWYQICFTQSPFSNPIVHQKWPGCCSRLE